MASPPDPQALEALGRAIAEIRRSKGLKQKQVADRISSYYSDERAYRRVERGERLPERDAVIAILATGLEVTEVQRINDTLALAGYASLTIGENQQLRLTGPQPIASSRIPRAEPRRALCPGFVGKAKTQVPALTLLLGSVIVSCLIAAWSRHIVFVVATALLYASLYAVSLLLETALDASRTSVSLVAAKLFCLMLITSVAALAVDAWLAGIGNPAALGLSLGIYLSAATVQWVLARGVLSESAVVPMQFQAHTAQAAHLKNTSYYLVVVVLFWLPPFHCIEALQREIRLGHATLVKALVAHRLILGRDFVALGPEWLWLAFLGLGLLAIPMAVRLLENLRSHPGLNTYTALLYLRAVLYFLLILVCLIWYSSEIGSLPFGDNNQS